MNRFFDPENPLMSFLNRLTDLVLLNLLFIVCCLPLFTIGAAFTALHFVCYLMIREEDCYITRDFFRSFKRNFRQATVLWLIFLVILLVAAADLVLMRNNGSSFPALLRCLIYADTVLAFAVCLYAFPLQARFENTIGGTLKNAFLLTFGAFPRTLAMLAVMAVPLLILPVIPRLLPVMVMIGFSVPVYCCAALYAPVFRRIEPAEAAPGQGEGWDESPDAGSLETGQNDGCASCPDGAEFRVQPDENRRQDSCPGPKD